MKIGLTFDLRHPDLPADLPDDAEEEFDKPSTIEALARALQALGHETVLLGDGAELVSRVLTDRPDFVFNLAEGVGAGRGREARVPALLELLGIPYTGSDPATLSVCLDKSWTKRIVAPAGVHVPAGIVLNLEGIPAEHQDGRLLDQLEEARLTCPLFAKPVMEGSSKGITEQSLIRALRAVVPTVRQLWERYRQPILLEEFIDGRELTVGILGNSPPAILGVMEVIPRETGRPFVYTLEVKRTGEEQVALTVPAPLSETETWVVTDAALRAFQALGCRDVARIDFRLREGVPYFIEANPLPGLSLVSDLVLIGEGMGVSHAALVSRILEAAVARQRG